MARYYFSLCCILVTYLHSITEIYLDELYIYICAYVDNKRGEGLKAWENFFIR